MHNFNKSRRNFVIFDVNHLDTSAS